MSTVKSVLVTGGTGSFGKGFVRRILEIAPDIERLVIFSRDELKQFEMAQIFSPERYPALRYFIGDVRDEDRLRRALEGIDTVVHAAALKQVPAADITPSSASRRISLARKTSSRHASIPVSERVVALSTDKAAAPINLYGATKLCSDKLFVAANNIRAGGTSVSAWCAMAM